MGKLHNSLDVACSGVVAAILLANWHEKFGPNKIELTQFPYFFSRRQTIFLQVLKSVSCLVLSAFYFWTCKKFFVISVVFRLHAFKNSNILLLVSFTLFSLRLLALPFSTFSIK